MLVQWKHFQSLIKVPPRNFLTIALAALFACSFAFSQTITGRLVGNVLDPAGAAMPQATVVATNVNTGIVNQTKTETDGAFVFPSLPSGSYNVRVEQPGFRTAISSGVEVMVAQSTRVNFVLEVGALEETVTVTSEAPLVESTTSDLGQVVDQARVQSLPLNGRIFSQLVNLVPGAIPSGHSDAAESASGAGARSSINSTVNGVNWSGTTYTLDGVNNSEPLNAFINIAPPLEAIEEFRVQTSNPSAEFGVFGGAVVNVTLRSGTNEFHGSLFEYLRNQSLNARSFFAASKAPFKTNQFGGTFGGPIIKNKAFFFGDYQGLRLRTGNSYLINVPTESMRNGYLKTEEGFSTVYDPNSASSSAGTVPFANNYIPASRWDSVTGKVMNLWPAANRTPSNPGPFQNYFQNVSDKQDVNAFDVKGDYHFDKLGRIFLRESYAHRNLDTVPPGNEFMSANPDSKSRNHNAVVGYSVALSPTVLNELRLGFNRFDTLHFGQDFGVDKNNELGIRNGNLAAFPESSGIAGFAVNPLYGTGAPGWTNAQRLANTYQLTNGTSWMRGSHTFKFGVDIRRIESTLTNPEGSGRGTFTFQRGITSNQGVGGSEFGSFLLGYPSTVFRSLVNTRPAVRITQAGFYFQDDYRVNQKLTLNMGLRWDAYTAPVDKHNRQVNFNPTTGKFNAATDDNRSPNVDTYMGNWSPRLGLAYSPDNGKTAIRAAGGVSYFSYNYGANGGTLERNFPLFQNFSLETPNEYRPFLSIANDGLPNFAPTPLQPEFNPAPGVSAFYVPQDVRPAVNIMYNVGVQRQLTKDTGVDVAYVGTRGTHLFRSRNINTPIVPGPGSLNDRRPYYAVSPLTPSINERGSSGASRYNSLQVKVNRRFSAGLQGLVSYTLAESKDNRSIFWVWDDSMNWLPSSGVDYRHVAAVSASYELPFGKGRQFLANSGRVADFVLGGWSVNGIASLRTGAPLAVTAANNRLNTGTGNWANMTCGSLSYKHTVESWFDTSCFADPTEAYTFGNAKTGSVRGPGMKNFDLSAFKKMNVTENKYFEFRAEFFNAFNTPVFNNPVVNRSSGNFGRITGTILTPREMQLGLKFVF